MKKESEDSTQANWISTSVERGLRVANDFGKIGKLAILPAIAILILVPGIVQQAFDPGKILHDTIVRTLPLTVTVGLIFVMLCPGFVESFVVFIVFSGFAFVVGAAIADYYGCTDCGGLALIKSASQLADDWTPKWFSEHGAFLNLIPFMIFCVIAYVQLYHFATFLASIICGVFLGFSLIFLFRPISMRT